jgi:hypothetical protein
MTLYRAYGRLSYPNIWEARPYTGPNMRAGDKNEPKFSADILIPKHEYDANGNVLLDPRTREPVKNRQAQEIHAVINSVAVAKWGKDTDRILAVLRQQEKTCFHDGDTKFRKEGYQGHWYLTAKSSLQPLIVDRDPFLRDAAGNVVKDPATGRAAPNRLTEADRRPYGGCYCFMLVDIYASNTGGERVNAEIKGLQFAEDGDAFGAGPAAAAEDFDNLAAGQYNGVAPAQEEPLA